MNTPIFLTKSQDELLREFYNLPLRRVLLSKKERNALWHKFKDVRMVPLGHSLDIECPALLAEMNKSIVSGKNIQSAVFSECVYAQALAEQFGLTEFIDCLLEPQRLSLDARNLIISHHLVIRYAYSNREGTRILVQAGGHGGVDAALISVVDKKVFTIEFKEPGAKTSEPDLPKYGEDGNLILTDRWAENNPQFVTMIKEQVGMGLNFWAAAGSNIHNFSPESIHQAVSDNYIGRKFADVICVEDSDDVLTMIPANQAQVWAEVRGEIRPAGRNHYEVWTPKYLERVIFARGGKVEDGIVTMLLTDLVTAKPRGGKGISRYKINPLFFVRAADTQLFPDHVKFKLAEVRQLNPTISAHMFFKDLKASKVRAYYID